MKNNQKNISLVKEKDFSDFSANYLKEKFKSLSHQSTVNIALSGGNTPLPILEILKDYNLDWEKFNFFLVDERFVDIHSKESNFKNINDVFFKFIKSKTFPVLKENLILEKIVSDYQKDIENHVPKNNYGFPVFDLIILGMGEDGHTASLFPNTKGLFNIDEVVIENFVPQLDSSRVTLTYPVLYSSKEIVVLLKGVKKNKIFNEIINGKGESYPIAKLINSNIKWILAK